MSAVFRLNFGLPIDPLAACLFYVYLFPIWDELSASAQAAPTSAYAQALLPSFYVRKNSSLLGINMLSFLHSKLQRINKFSKLSWHCKSILRLIGEVFWFVYVEYWMQTGEVLNMD